MNNAVKRKEYGDIEEAYFLSFNEGDTIKVATPSRVMYGKIVQLRKTGNIERKIDPVTKAFVHGANERYEVDVEYTTGEKATVSLFAIEKFYG